MIFLQYLSEFAFVFLWNRGDVVNVLFWGGCWLGTKLQWLNMLQFHKISSKSILMAAFLKEWCPWHTGKSRMDSQNSDIRKMVGSNLDKLWLWKVTTFTRKCIFKFSMFPCYVSAPWVQQQALNWTPPAENAKRSRIIDHDAKRKVYLEDLHASGDLSDTSFLLSKGFWINTMSVFWYLLKTTGPPKKPQQFFSNLQHFPKISNIMNIQILLLIQQHLLIQCTFQMTLSLK